MSAPGRGRHGAAGRQQRRAVARNERLRLLLRSATFISGMIIVLFWVGCALFGARLVPYDPYAGDLLNTLAPPSADNWFGTDQLGRDVFSRVIVGARDILTIAPLATLLGTVLGTALGLITGYFRGLVDDVVEPHHRRGARAAARHHRAAGAGGARQLEHHRDRRHRHHLRAHHRAHRARGRALGARSRLRGAAASCAARTPSTSCSSRSCPTCCRPSSSRRRCGSATRSSPWRRSSFLGFGIQPPSADWGLAISDSYGLIDGGFWWTVLFDAFAIASLVVGVNLVADGVQGAFET